MNLNSSFNTCEKNRTIILEGNAEVKGNIQRSFPTRSYCPPVAIALTSEEADTVQESKKYFLLVDKTKIPVTSAIVMEPKVHGRSPSKTHSNVILLSTKDGRVCYLKFESSESFAQWRQELGQALIEVLCADAMVPLYTGRLSSIRLKNCLYTCSTLSEDQNHPCILRIKRILGIKEDVTRAMETLQSNPRALTKTEMQTILRSAKSEFSLQSDPDVLFLTHLATLQGCGLSDVDVLCKGLALYDRNTDHPITVVNTTITKTPARTDNNIIDSESVKENLTVKFSQHINTAEVHNSPVVTVTPKSAMKTPTTTSAPTSSTTPLRDHVQFVAAEDTANGVSEVAVTFDGKPITTFRRPARPNRIVYRKPITPVKAARTPVKCVGDMNSSSSSVSGGVTGGVLSSGMKSSLALSGGSARKDRRHISFNQIVSTSDGTPSRLMPTKFDFGPKTPTSAKKTAAASNVLQCTRSLTPMNDKQIKAMKEQVIQSIVKNYLVVMEAVAHDLNAKSDVVPDSKVKNVAEGLKSPKGSKGKSTKSPAKKEGAAFRLSSPELKIFNENIHNNNKTTSNGTAEKNGNRQALTNLSASKVNSRPTGDAQKKAAGGIKSAVKVAFVTETNEKKEKVEFPYQEKEQEMVGCYKKMNKVLEFLKPVDDEEPEVRFKTLMKAFNMNFDEITESFASKTVTAADLPTVCKESENFLASMRRRSSSVEEMVGSENNSDSNSSVCNTAPTIEVKEQPSVVVLESIPVIEMPDTPVNTKSENTSKTPLSLKKIENEGNMNVEDNSDLHSRHCLSPAPRFTFDTIVDDSQPCAAATEEMEDADNSDENDEDSDESSNFNNDDTKLNEKDDAESTKTVINRLAIILATLYLAFALCFVVLQHIPLSAPPTVTQRPVLNLERSLPILLLPAPGDVKPTITYDLTKTEMLTLMTTGRHDDSLLQYFFDHVLINQEDETMMSDKYEITQYSNPFGTMTVKIVPKRTSLMNDLSTAGLSVWTSMKSELIEEVSSM